MKLATAHDVIAAQALLADRLPPTPLIFSPALSAASGATVWLKCECFAAVGSFKSRGALNCFLRLDAATLAGGLICASTGKMIPAVVIPATVDDPVMILNSAAISHPSKSGFTALLVAMLITSLPMFISCNISLNAPAPANVRMSGATSFDASTIQCCISSHFTPLLNPSK